MKHRRGVSLVELMVVIAIITVVFGMVGVLFHRLFLTEQMAMRAALIERSTSRLAAQFRRDVRAATAVKRVTADEDAVRSGGHEHPEASRLELDTISPIVQKVVYSSREGTVSRELIVEDKVASREQYRLPECLIRFPAPKDEADAGLAGVELISLVIERQGSTITPQPQAIRPWRSLVVEAVLGRDATLPMARQRGSSTTGREESK